jgi:hypothetical protein
MTHLVFGNRKAPIPGLINREAKDIMTPLITIVSCTVSNILLNIVYVVIVCVFPAFQEGDYFGLMFADYPALHFLFFSLKARLDFMVVSIAIAVYILFMFHLLRRTKSPQILMIGQALMYFLIGIATNVIYFETIKKQTFTYAEQINFIGLVVPTFILLIIFSFSFRILPQRAKIRR